MVFSIPSYIGVGDRVKQPVDARAKGATFLVGRPKTGTNPDALFQKEHLYLWNGERGGDAETERRRAECHSHQKNLTPNGFAYVGPTPRGCGLGSYFGCFQSVPPVHMADHPESHAEALARYRRLRGDDAGAEDGEGGAAPASSSAASPSTYGLRGVYTSPAPKGCGYGYANLGISPLGTNYIANIYDQPRLNAAAEREAWKLKMPAEPFKPAGRRGYTFDESTATGVSRCYVMTVPFSEKKMIPPMQHFKVDQPWRPAGYVEDKPLAMDYWEDPYGGYDPRKEAKEYVKKPSSEVFLPSSSSDTFWYTQSIVFKRV